MLTSEDFELWCADINLSPAGRDTVAQIRASQPSRSVSSRCRNVVGRFPSQKMGVTIQFESHTVELAAIYELEHDRDVLEYYDQPPPIKLSYHTPAGRSVTATHTPDFFVLRSERAGWEECKTERRLRALSVAQPERYRLDAGTWQCAPGDRVASALGLYYRLRSSAGIDWVFQRNLRFLADYLSSTADSIADDLRLEILSLVPEHGPVNLFAILDHFGEGRAGEVYSLIARGDLYVDLTAGALVEPSRVRVYRSEVVARAVEDAEVQAGAIATLLECVPGRRLVWDGRPWTIANAGERAVWLVDDERRLAEIARTSLDNLVSSGAVVPVGESAPHTDGGRDLLAAAHPDDLAEALVRLDVVDRYRRGEGTGVHARRTVQAWATRWRRAESVHGAGLVGLIPRRHARGNRKPKLCPEARALLDDAIRTRYETPRQVARVRVHEAIVLACDGEGLVPPSYKTVCTEIRKRSGADQVRAREGKRAAYQVEPFYWELEMTTPRHGDRPFEIVHIDHTEFGVELVDSETGKLLGRPWVTLCTDACSRRVLALACLYDSPSYRSCMMVLRDLVRRHLRFPDTIVVDNGREFDSVYFETLLARFRTTKKSRPPGAPRFGSVCERLFGTSSSELINTLLGNTQIARRERAGAASGVPKRQAVWTLPEFGRFLRAWAFEVYDTREHVALGASPRDAFAMGLARSGRRDSRIVPYDETFRMLTLPSTSKGTARVVAGRGIRIRSIYYWAVTDVFRSPRIEGTDVPVRYDPLDAGVAYAYVASRWVRCVSEHYASLRGRSEREIELASLELRKRREGPCRQRPEAIRQLAAFLGSVEAAESLQLQRKRDQQTRVTLADAEANQSGDGAASEAAEPTPAAPRAKRRMRPRTARGPALTEFEQY